MWTRRSVRRRTRCRWPLRCLRRCGGRCQNRATTPARPTPIHAVGVALLAAVSPCRDNTHRAAPTATPTIPTANPTSDTVPLERRPLMSDCSLGGQALPVQWPLSDDLSATAIAPKIDPTTMPAAPTPKAAYAPERIPDFESLAPT